MIVDQFPNGKNPMGFPHNFFYAHMGHMGFSELVYEGRLGMQQGSFKWAMFKTPVGWWLWDYRELDQPILGNGGIKD